MRAGKLRHYVTFQTKIVAQDSDGATVEEWVDAFGHGIWAAITFPSGKESSASEEIHSRIVAIFTVRHRNDFNPSMRILYRNVIYNIDALLPDPDSGLEYLKIPTYSGMNNG